MTTLFEDMLHEGFGTWPYAFMPYGGADFGEIAAVAATVGNGDDSAYHAAWTAAAARLEAEAEDTLARGHVGSARGLWLRASAFYSTSLHPLYGAPVDPRLLDAFRRQMVAFNRGLELGPFPVWPQQIPFGPLSLPAYFIPAEGRETEVRPLVVLNGGYDSTVTDVYFMSAVAASRRGYHSLVFDGPGQGRLLYEQQVALRPDWEMVIAAVMDVAVTHPLVDPARIALSGLSLGGYLVARAASVERRIAALIADPGHWGLADSTRATLRHMLKLPHNTVHDIAALDQSLLDKMEAKIRKNRQMNWMVVQRGFWVHGVNTLRDFLISTQLFTMESRAELIRCPTLITQAEKDPVAAGAATFFDALRCPKTLLRFTAAEGAGEHCEMRNRSLLNRRVLDWLDEQFGEIQ